jgi:uncharacterized membrane protein
MEFNVIKDIKLKKIFNNNLIIFLIIIIYIFIMTYFTFLRYMNFYTTNWDLGINEQLLWTTTHGYLMYETGDGMSISNNFSFLQIHSAYIAFIIAYIYYIFPSAITIFVIQNTAIALSIIPLYKISERLVKKQILIYMILIIYLFNFAIISAIFYDFHWESFMPLELLIFFYLIYIKKYKLSLIPFLFGSGTLEVFPWLAIGVILYFIFVIYGKKLIKFWRNFKDKEFNILVIYIILSIFVYVLIRILQVIIIPHYLLESSVTYSAGEVAKGSIYGYLIINLNNYNTLMPVLFYYLLLYASFGFIPLLYPKHIIMNLPWLYFTIFVSQGYARFFGNQYALIPIAPIAIGLIFGIKKIEDEFEDQNNYLKLFFSFLGVSLTLLILSMLYSRQMLRNAYYPDVLLVIFLIIIIVVLIMVSFKRKDHLTFKINGLKRIVKKSFVFILIIIIIFNLFMSPLNMNNFKATPMPGYAFSYSKNPAFNYISNITQLIPENSYVLASDNLFPFVANNPHAYSLLWFSYNYSKIKFFPFNATNPPPYVFLSSSQIYATPSFLVPELFNRSIYGIRSFIYCNGYPGSIYLFEKGYKGSPVVYEAVKAPGEYYFYGKNLAIGMSGEVVKYNDSMFGYVIESHKATNLSNPDFANIWYGPYYTFLPGNYTVTISLKGGLYNTSLPSSTPLLYMDSKGWGSPYYYRTIITAGQLSSTSWTNITFNISISEPFPNTEFRGYLQYTNGVPNGYIILNYIEVKMIN